MKRLVPVLLTIVCLFALALLAVHYRFPYEPALKLAVQGLEQQMPVAVRFEKPKALSPFRVEVPGLRILLAVAGAERELISGKRLLVAYRPFSLVFGKLPADWIFETDGGRIDGRCQYHPLSGLITAEVTNIDLPDFAFREPGGQGALKGRLSGRLVISGHAGRFPESGEGRISMTNGRIDNLQIPQFPFTSIDFTRLEASFKLEKDQRPIIRVLMDGPQAGVTLTGTVDGFQNPRINLTGSARVGPAEQPMAEADIRVTGPLFQPAVNILSMKSPALN